MKLSTPLQLVYFGIAFTSACTLVMFALSFIRPLLDESTPTAVRVICMVSPLLISIPYGLRVVKVAKRDQLRLGSALIKALKR
ncbi:MAG: hypothetical protein VYA30_00140 [Myxococcota bacterium]|nr:hypothetical protein [Myxococcota bacterium]